MKCRFCNKNCIPLWSITNKLFYGCDHDGYKVLFTDISLTIAHDKYICYIYDDTYTFNSHNGRCSESSESTKFLGMKYDDYHIQLNTLLEGKASRFEIDDPVLFFKRQLILLTFS